VPFWIRILQCARRLRDDRQALHAVNIGKYGAGVAALVVRYARDTAYASSRRPHAAGWTAAAAVACGVSSAYSFVWDLYMDWGLLRPTRCASRRGLRDELMLQAPAAYYAAMALNGALRLTWVLLYVRWDNAGAAAIVLPSAMAAVEVLRRCVWNYFRVENEHVANAGSFRATVMVPLPGAPARRVHARSDGDADDAAALVRAPAVAGFAAAPHQARIPPLTVGDTPASDGEARSAPPGGPDDGEDEGGAAAAARARLVGGALGSSRWDSVRITLSRMGTFARSLDDDDGGADAPAAAAAAAGPTSRAANAAAPLPRMQSRSLAPPLGEYFRLDADADIARSDDDDD
jgi:hypothetical protein